MVVLDEDLFIIALLLFLFIFLFAAGQRLSPMFMLLAVFAGLFLSTETFRVTASVPLAIILAAVALLTLAQFIKELYDSKEGYG